MTTKTAPQFVVCIHNEGYQASLEPRKIYQKRIIFSQPVCLCPFHSHKRW